MENQPSVNEQTTQTSAPIRSRVRVLILPSYEEEEQIIEALRAGASGYLIKESDIGKLLLAIQSVARGNTYFSPSLSQREQGSDFLLRARNRTDLIRYAIRRGIIGWDPVPNVQAS